MSRLIHRSVMISCLVATLSSPITWAQDAAEPGLLAQLLHLSGLIEERCGERLDVVWVDERGKNPPCTMAYSGSCTEMQSTEPQNCTVMMKTLAE
jgi:hypothetical protein